MALNVPIIADTSGLTRGLKQGTSSLRKFGKMAAFVGGAAAIGGLVAVVTYGTKKFIEQEKAVAQTNARLKSTGAVANVTAKDVVKLSDAIAGKTGLDDDSIHSMENMLLTFTNIRNEVGKNNDVFNQATRVTADLSVAFEKDLSSSAIMVGKALNDPIKGITALGKAGVQFTAGQKKTITALVESGRILDAQKLIIKELNTQVGGSAEAYGKTLPGQLSIAKQAFEEISRSLVAKFLPSVTRALGGVAKFIDALGAQPTLTAKIQFVIGAFQDIFWNGVKTISDWWQKRKVTFEDNPANRLKVTITDSGEEQLNTLFDSMKKTLDKKADTLGRALGKKIVRAIFGGGKDQASESGGQFINDVFVALLVNKPALDLGKRVVLGIFDGMREQFNQSLTDNPVTTFINGLAKTISPVLYKVGTTIADQIEQGQNDRMPKVRKAFVGEITKTVREAVNAARQGLAGLGSTLGGMLSTITGSSSPEAKRAAEIRKQQKVEAAAREKTRLESAIATAETDDDRKQAQQDLNDFILEQEATRLEDSVAAQQSANQRAIDDLIASFNRGDIAAAEFRSRLDSIIGGASGAELGMAFADGFAGAFNDIINAAKDIQSVVSAAGGRDITPVVGTPAADAARDAHKEWAGRRAARLKMARDARRAKDSAGGAKITDAEQTQIDNIMRQWDNKKENREPIRMAAGGILKRQVFTAGEAGREAVIPLGSSEAMNILRQAVGGGGGGATYVLNIQAGLGTNPDELGRVIVESIKKFEKRNGQVFAGPQIQATSAGVSTSGGTQSRNLRKN